MKIQTMAQYKNESKLGTICISRIVDKKPIEYTLQLFENSTISLKKNKFTTIPLAISHASLYGFIPDFWKITEIEY